MQINETLNNNVVKLFFITMMISTETDSYIKSRLNNTMIIAVFDSFSRINTNFNKQLLYHTNKLIELQRLCISNFCVENIMEMTHDNEHFKFAKL